MSKVKLSPEHLEVFQRLKDDLEHYALKCLKIRTKKGDIESFIFNKAQKFLHEKLQEQKRLTGKVRAMILKGRQQGCSTYVGARFFHQVTQSFGTHAFILTHALDATNNLYAMAKRFYENCPEVMQPQVATNNSKELIFGKLDSGYKIGTAENKAVGRSSTIQLFHGSEVAFWANAEAHAKGILQAVPGTSGSEIILESTANGVGNYFHQMWQKAESGESEFIPIFIPWFWQEEYTKEIPKDFTLNHTESYLREMYDLSLEQLAWRRSKIVDFSINGQDGEKSFKQEYPCNATEAFQITGEDTFIDAMVVMHARKANVEKYGPLIMGVDLARMGADRSSIIFRQGRCAFGLKSYTKKDVMEMTGIIHTAILEHGPDAVAVDIGGLGAGAYDRLKELGHKNVYAINGGASPLDAIKYKNKRAETWGLMKEWLFDVPVQIPDCDSLHADLCNIKYKYNSNSQLVMEDKDEMKKRGIRSPDEGDALSLTFAIPSSMFKAKVGENKTVSTLASDFNAKLKTFKQKKTPY